MKQGISALALGAMLFALGFSAEAQQPAKVYRIGMLVSGSVASHSRRIDAFRQGLRELGYVEGKNITIEYKYAEGNRERFANLAAEMVRLKPDVIYVGSTGFTAAAKKATSTIPIVAVGGDLVGAGLVASLARPGGNVTGSTNISPDISGKRLELLKEAVPKAARVAVLWGSSRDDEDEVKQTEIAARLLGVTIYPVPVRAADEIAGAFVAIKRENANALVIIQGSFTNCW
jgi:putative tryptophan/tyrosine transport system substrate-binding protein